MFFDAAASAQPRPTVMEAVMAFMVMYGSIHRGAGERSKESSRAYEEAREEVKQFLKATDEDAVVQVANTTDGINRLAQILAPQLGGGSVLVSDIEHSANDLPWRRVARVRRFETPNFKITAESVDLALSANSDIRLVAVAGASNITGQIVDAGAIHEVCQRHNVPLFFDCSQRAAHAECSLRDCEMLAFSGHKIGAPFGAGILAGRRSLLETSHPYVGGGSVVYTTDDKEYHKPAPEGMEVGTPNGGGMVAVAAACREIMRQGYSAIREHDRAVEGWYRQYMPLHELDVWFLEGTTLVFRPREGSAKQLSERLGRLGVEHRFGAFCVYGAVARKMGVDRESVEQEVLLTGKLPKEFGALRLSAEHFVGQDTVAEAALCLSMAVKE